VANVPSSEKTRYSRQVLLPEIGPEGQSKLKASSVLIIGIGGLGSPILQYLSSAGIGTIGIVDFDSVDESNLQRQVIYSTDDIGMSKVIAAQRRIQQTNPYCRVIAIEKKLDIDNALEILAPYDLILDGSDNFETKYLINDACLILNKPFVFGSIYRFEGQLSVFNFKGGPTYRCIFPESSNLMSCSENGVLGVLPGIVGCLMANEAIKVLLNFGDILRGKLLVVDSKSLSIKIHKFSLIDENRTVTVLEKNDQSCNKDLEIEDINSLGDDFVLVDVRDPHEHNESNIGGINLPLYLLKKNIKELSIKVIGNKSIIFYCKSGYRSNQAARLAKSLGLKNVFSLKGGINQ
jgi:molybdopterin/thiamine biosynthesis adenylyltransferase/rhodanese-related sulfurtransferase